MVIVSGVVFLLFVWVLWFWLGYKGGIERNRPERQFQAFRLHKVVVNCCRPSALGLAYNREQALQLLRSADWPVYAELILKVLSSQGFSQFTDLENLDLNRDGLTYRKGTGYLPLEGVPFAGLYTDAHQTVRMLFQLERGVGLLRRSTVMRFENDCMEYGLGGVLIDTGYVPVYLAQSTKLYLSGGFQLVSALSAAW